MGKLFSFDLERNSFGLRVGRRRVAETNPQVPLVDLRGTSRTGVSDGTAPKTLNFGVWLYSITLWGNVLSPTQNG